MSVASQLGFVPGRSSRRRSTFRAFTAVVSVFASVLILYPLLNVLFSTFVSGEGVDLGPFRATWSDPEIGRVLWNTCVLVVIAASISVIVGTVFAWLVERTDIGFLALFRYLPVAPLVLPPVAGAIGWVLLLAPTSGFLNVGMRKALSPIGIEISEGPLSIFNWPGMIFVYSVYMIPEVFLVVAGAFKNLDSGLEEAARVNGAGPSRTLFTVSLPNVLPSIATSALLSLITALSLVSVPIIISSQAYLPVLSVRVVELMTAQFPPKIGPALVLCLLMLVVIGVGWSAQARVIRSGRFAKIGGRGMRASRVSLGRWRPLIRAFMICYMFATTVLPFAALLLVSVMPFWSQTINLTRLNIQQYKNILSASVYREAMLNSVGLGIATACIAVLVASLMAYYSTEAANSRIARATDGIAKLPGAVSHLVVGIACVAAFAGPPFHLSGTLTILLIAYIILYMPQASLTARSALGQIGQEMSEASLMSGVSPGKTFMRITLPLMTPSLAVGAALVFVLVAGEITASIMLAGIGNPVIGFVILDFWTTGSYTGLAALGTIVAVLHSAVLLLVLMIRRGRFTGRA